MLILKIDDFIPFKYSDRYGLIDEATFYVYKTNQYNFKSKMFLNINLFLYTM